MLLSDSTCKNDEFQARETVNEEKVSENVTKANYDTEIKPISKPWYDKELEEDPLMVLLKNPGITLNPQRDIDDCLHGRVISYLVAKVI